MNYKDIMELPKMTHLHLHFNAMVCSNVFKTYMEDKSPNTIIPVLPNAKNNSQMKYNQRRMRSFYKNDVSFVHILTCYFEVCLKNRICYTEFRGILGLFENFTHKNTLYEDRYIIDVYYRVLIMLKTLYTWKLKFITPESHPIHYNKLLSMLNNVDINILHINDTSFLYSKELFVEVIDQDEILNSPYETQLALMMSFKFILGHPKGLIQQFGAYLATARKVNELLGFKFIFAWDLYSNEDDQKLLIENDEYVSQLLSDYPDFLFICHGGETRNKYRGHSNIQYLIQKGCKRIGHAFNLLNDELSLYNKIYIEVCPISNQVLGFYKRIEDHPAKHKIKDEKLVISINSDDPGLFGYSDVSKDWYLIYKYWKLTVDDIYCLIYNGLKTACEYGGMDNEYKKLCHQIVDRYKRHN